MPSCKPDPAPTKESAASKKSGASASARTPVRQANSSAPSPTASPADAGSVPQALSALEREQALARTYQPLLARARKLQAEKKFDEAGEAFTQAAGKGEDVYHRAVGELGYLDLVEHRGKREETEFALLVAATSPESDVRGQAWFNLARLYGEGSEPEAARASLARSLASRESAPARSQLGARSACVAQIDAQGPRSRPDIVSGWSGVCKTLQLCEGGESESEARRKACVTDAGGGAGDSHGCEDAPPWHSSFVPMSYTLGVAYIMPIDKRRFFVVQSRVGGWEAICGGESDFAVEAKASVVRVSDRLTYSEVGRGRMTPQADSDNGLCWRAPEVHHQSFYELSSGKLLAALSVLPDFPVEVEINLEAKRLELSGGGCEGFVPLDGSLKFSQ